MDAGHVLKLSSEDGQLIVTLQGPRGGGLASGPVALDEMALEDAGGPSQYGDVLLAACESAAQANAGGLVGMAPALVEAGTGAVVAMRGKVGIDVGGVVSGTLAASS